MRGVCPSRRGVAATSLETLSVRLRPSVAFAFLAIALAACGSSPAPSAASPSSPPSPSSIPTLAPSPSPSAAPATLLLKVTSEGGFINPAATLAVLPTVAVYADGRIFTPGPVDAIAPAGLVPPLVVREVGTTGAVAILAAIKAAGLDKSVIGGPGVPGDSGTTVFTVVVDGATTVSRVAGGGPPGPGKPGGGSGDPGRAAAFALLDRLMDPTETWGAPAAPSTVYAPSGYRIFVAPGAPATDPATTQAPVAWPLSTLLDAFGTAAVPDRGITGLRQGVVLGADAAQLAPILRAATVATPFTSGGKSFTLFVRPLLPDESGG